MKILSITREDGTPTAAVDLVYSPDDYGYYLSQYDFQNVKNRTSVKIYPSIAAATADWKAGTVEWEEWY